MRISDWSSDVCSSDLFERLAGMQGFGGLAVAGQHRHGVRRTTQGDPHGLFAVDDDRAVGQRMRTDRHQRQRVETRVHDRAATGQRSEEHTSELQSLMRISYAVFCLKKKKKNTI